METVTHQEEESETILSEAEKEYFSKMIPKLMDNFRAEFYKQKIN